jgi:hypothetical protein
MGDRGPFKSYATMKKEKELKEGKGIWHVCYLVLWNVCHERVLKRARKFLSCVKLIHLFINLVNYNTKVGS